MAPERTKRLSRATEYTRKARGTRRMLEGLFRLDRLLQSGGAYSLKWLAHELEASTRTVQRYMEVLRERLGAEVIFDRERGGYCYPADALPVPAPHLSEDELLAIYVAEPILAQYDGTPLAHDFRRAWDQMTKGLPRSVRARIQQTSGRVSIPASKPTRDDIERFRRIFDAVMNDRRLSITYYSAYRSASSNRVVDPYALRAVAGDWYLVAYCHEREAVLPFKLTRIWTAAPTKESFDRPEDFDVDAMFEHSFGIYRLSTADTGEPEPIELRFEPEAAKHVRERVWHPSQELEELQDGGVLLTMRVERTPELERWIRGWGPGVGVRASGARRGSRDDFLLGATQNDAGAD